MDFSDRMAELDEVLREYRGCVAFGELALADKVLDNYWLKLRGTIQNAYSRGYNDGRRVSRERQVING